MGPYTAILSVQRKKWKIGAWLFAHSPPVWLSWVSSSRTATSCTPPRRAAGRPGQAHDPQQALVVQQAGRPPCCNGGELPARRRAGWEAVARSGRRRGPTLQLFSWFNLLATWPPSTPAGDHRRATPHPKMPFKCKPSAPRVFLRQQGASLVNGQALKFSQRVAGGKTAELAELQNITDLGDIWYICGIIISSGSLFFFGYWLWFGRIPFSAPTPLTLLKTYQGINKGWPCGCGLYGFDWLALMGFGYTYMPFYFSKA